MLRIIMLASGILLAALGCIWFFTPLLDPIAAAVTGIGPASAPKLALANLASIVFGVLGLGGLGLVGWSALGIWSSARPDAPAR